MKGNRRTGAVLLLCVLLVAAAGCKKGEKAQETPTIGGDVTQYMNDAVITVDGISVSYREAMLYLQSTKQEYESAYGGEIWQYMLNEDGTTLGEWVKNQTLEQIIYIKIVCEQAKKLGIELDSEEKKMAAERTEAYMAKAEYTTLALYGIARKDVERVYMDNALAQKIYDSVTLNVDTDISNEEAAQKHLQSLMLKNYHEDQLGNRSALTVLELIETLDRFDSLYTSAQTTKDFYSLAYANTENQEYLDIWVGEGDLPEELSEAYDLKTGEVMQIRAADGYYVFYCVSEYDEDATIAKKEELIALRQEEAFRQLYETWRAEAKIEMNEVLWKAIGFDMDAEG
ncbi:MAG: SurA N-terminal domain-containing protein [Lachnospiraceae bacterium]|nr:SurA N-terminal domain-containing protein [Lachnospiraceae bacterium]